MANDIAGVRINPANVEFVDTESNDVYRINITVKNVSKSSKNIRYYGPNTKVCIFLYSIYFTSIVIAFSFSFPFAHIYELCK